MFRRWSHPLSSIALGCTVVLLSSGVRPSLRAQANTAEAPAAVARLSVLDGEVHVAATGYHADAVDAALNMPLAAGQSIQTGPNADAEVEFPDGSVLRSTASSSATLIRFQPQTEIGLDDGLYYLELRAGTDAQFTVYAGDLSVEPKENASFRVRVQDGQPEIAVLRGSVSITKTSSYTVDLKQGESLRMDPKDNRRYLLADTVGAETGDSWNERRAQQVADAAAAQTIARDGFAGGQGYGWSDLDSSGAWYPLPGEGLVWQPHGVDAGFDPYGYGNWVYSGYAGGGYVWASGYPWGWLPYHCGSWGFFSGFGWGWQPAAGCVSYGGGWPVGGFPVKHPPHSWRGPLPPRPPAEGGIVTRHPTLPGTPQHGRWQVAIGPHTARPIEVNGVTLHALAPVAPAPTPRGSSAVGSALRRDYPVQSGTHQPLMGRESAGVAAMPGRAPEWHGAAAPPGRPHEAGNSPREAGFAASNVRRSNAEGAVAEPGVPAAAGVPAVPAMPGTVGGFVVTTPGVLNRTFGGWHNRILQAQPNPGRPAGAGAVGTVGPLPAASRPTGAGIVAPLPGGVHPPPGMTPPTPITPVTHAPVGMPQTRPMPVAPRSIAPSPSPAPHFNPPPAQRMPPPSAPSAPRMSAPSPGAMGRPR